MSWEKLFSGPWFSWRLGGILLASLTGVRGQLPTAPTGFKVELVASAKAEGDSWVCMTIDPQGRVILSPEGHPGYLVQISFTNGGQMASMRKIDRPVGSAMGLLCAFDSLYVDGDGPKGYGVYRLRHNSTNDEYGWPELITQFGGAVYDEHGAHAIVQGPDDRLYIVCGNFVTPPAVSSDSPLQQCSVDQLLPVDDNADGFGVGLRPPGGFVLRIGPDGRNPELFCGGMRNVYDIAFNADHELFGLDNDQEIDCGLPWYRPNRLLHLVSGGDYGHREGTAPWPSYYPDALPAVTDIGLGAPSGIQFGSRGNFPGNYKTALYALDWASGRILAAHLKPTGATYGASVETFLQGKALDPTDIEFAPNGPMYFITGGRKTQSSLYRVSYVGLSLAPQNQPDKAEQAAPARELRRRLESFHGRVDPGAVSAAWPSLDSDDRFIRYAARLAIESQPIAEWELRALSESRTNAALEALLAVARCGGPEAAGPTRESVARFPLNRLNEEQQLKKLRVLQLLFVRLGRPPAGLASPELEELNQAYPAASERLNAELCQLLVYFEAPDVVGKTLALLDAAPTQEEQIQYIFFLRQLKRGWTLAQRRHYFEWFNLPAEKRAPPSRQLRQWFADAGRPYADGSSMAGFLANFRTEAVQSLDTNEHAALADWLQSNQPVTAKLPAARPRPFIRNWTVEDFLPLLEKDRTNTQAATHGAAVFNAAGCVQCHRMGGSGGLVGPDLATISSRYSARDILESILDPSKVVAEQYRNSTILTRDGDELTGRVVAETAEEVTLMTDPVNRSIIKVAKTNIAKREVSTVSPMPQGLLNSFRPDEVMALVAYLESGGKR